MESVSISDDSCFRCKNKSCCHGLLTQTQLELFNKNCKKVSFNSKEELLNVDSTFGHVSYLNSGFVIEVKRNPNHGDQVFRIITSGSYLGLPTVFTDHKLNTEFLSVSSGSLCLIDKTVFKQLIIENGKFAFEILTKCGRDNLNNYHKYIETNHKQIYGRVADLLLYFADNIYKNLEFTNLLSREEMASMINSTRESVSRAMHNFIADGVISTRGRKIKIEKREVLESISRHG
jgi:CRP-like cAMP-binding protein